MTERDANWRMLDYSSAQPWRPLSAFLKPIPPYGYGNQPW